MPSRNEWTRRTESFLFHTSAHLKASKRASIWSIWRRSVLEEIGQLRTELDRLNSLAQLGIAVEIVGHELQSYDDIIGSAIKRLPENIRDSEAVKDIEFGYEGLTDQLRFLSPLRLAGQKIQRWITGDPKSYDYLSDFFKLTRWQRIAYLLYSQQFVSSNKDI